MLDKLHLRVVSKVNDRTRDTKWSFVGAAVTWVFLFLLLAELALHELLGYIKKGIDYTFTGAHFLGRILTIAIVSLVLGFTLSEFAIFLLGALVFDILVGRVITEFVVKCCEALCDELDSFLTQRRAKKD